MRKHHIIKSQQTIKEEEKKTFYAIFCCVVSHKTTYAHIRTYINSYMYMCTLKSYLCVVWYVMHVMKMIDIQKNVYYRVYYGFLTL